MNMSNLEKCGKTYTNFRMKKSETRERHTQSNYNNVNESDTKIKPNLIIIMANYITICSFK